MELVLLSGNFTTAGSVELTTKDHPDNNLVKLEGGMFHTAKATTAVKDGTISRWGSIDELEGGITGATRSS